MTANSSHDPPRTGPAAPGGPDPPPEQPVTDMSGQQLDRHRRALIHILRRSRKGEPRYERASARLADVIAEERARRLIACGRYPGKETPREQ
jgi:hypothetical protein